LLHRAIFLLLLSADAALAADSKPAAELWVDAFVSVPGDGSEGRPYQNLEAALSKLPRDGGRIFLAKGLYRGPFQISAAVELRGTSSAVLFVEGGDATVVTARGSVLMKNLAIQGGGLGVDSFGRLTLEEVELSGQRRIAVQVSSGEIEVRRSRFAATISDGLGISAKLGARIRISDSRFDGPFKRAVELRGNQGSFEARDVAWEGAKIGIHQIGGKSFLQNARFSDGSGPAVTVGKGELRAEQMVVIGHEYGVLANEGAVIFLRDFTSFRSQRAGIALVHARAELEGIQTVDSGTFGAIQLVSSEASIRRFWLHRSSDYAIQARDSRLQVDNGAITEVRGESSEDGDAIHLRHSLAAIQSVLVHSARGAGILAAEASSVAVRDVQLLSCRGAGVLGDTLAQVRASSLSVRSSDGAAVVALGRSTIAVEGLISEQNREGPVWAECQNGARIRLWRAHVEDGFELSPCVEGR